MPYKGPAPAMQDVLGGQMDCGLLAGPTVLPPVRSGKLVALGVSGARRSAMQPDVPTIAEAVRSIADDSRKWGEVAPPIKLGLD